MNTHTKQFTILGYKGIFPHNTMKRQHSEMLSIYFSLLHRNFDKFFSLMDYEQKKQKKNIVVAALLSRMSTIRHNNAIRKIHLRHKELQIFS